MADREKSWVINYLPEEKVRLTGKLIVTPEELRFRAMYDSSFKAVAKKVGLAAGTLGVTDGHLLFLREDGADAEVVIPRTAVRSAEATKKGMMKQVRVNLTDGSSHLFEYGLLSVKKIVAAINS